MNFWLKWFVERIILVMAILVIITMCSGDSAFSFDMISPQAPQMSVDLKVLNSDDENYCVLLLPIKAEKNVRLHILDMLGREVKDTTYRKLPVPGELTFDTHRLREGLYFLRVNYGNYQWATKLVKQKDE